MKYQNKLIATLMFVTFPLAGNENQFFWPIEINPEKQHSITSTFGESRYDHFHAGLDIAGENIPVFPVQKGTLMYLDFKNMYFLRFPSGSGNQIWLNHNHGTWSGYFHLNQFFIPDTALTIKKNESFSLTGNTGRSYGAHLHFFIIKEYGKKIINPLNILTKEMDSLPPKIEYLAFIIRSQNQEQITFIFPEKRTKLRLTKPRMLYLKVYDPGAQNNTRRIPYRIEWLFQNQYNTQKGSIQFDYLESTKEGLLLNGKYKFEHIYDKNLLKIGIFNYIDGDNQVIITAYDKNGNFSQNTFYLRIKKEY